MKTGLIVEGGGMKCAYSAGVLDIFLDEQLQFDYCIGVSAGSANCASFLGGQRERNMRFYVEHVKDPHYISLRSLFTTGSLFGLEYIYGNMTNEGGIDPLDYDAYFQNPTETYFPATDAETGKPHYFNKNEVKRNQYQPIMASCALPVACRPIYYQGHTYFDGGVSDSIPVQHALEQGCERMIVLLSKPRGYRMVPQGGKAVYTMALRRKYPQVVEALNHRHEMYNRQMEQLEELVRQGQALVFCPSAEISIGTYTTDPAVMKRLYENGLSDGIKRRKEVEEFLHGR